MSFICDSCKTPTRPGVKPVVRVVETRSVDYHVSVRVEDDEQGERHYEKQFRHGTEIVREERVCPTCANIPERKVEVVDLEPYRGIINGMANTHLRGCKKDVKECATCSKFVEKVAGFPLNALSYALSESVPKYRKVAGVTIQ